MTEAYDSDSDSGSSTRSVSHEALKTEAAIADTFDDEAEDEVEEVLDWENVMSRLRVSVSDRSKVRRTAFINRYLSVTESSPPFNLVPGIFTTLLSVLPTLPLQEHSEQIVEVITSLVKRDENLSEGVEGKLKLGDKLVKWVSIETEKLSAGTKTTTASVFLPYLFTVTALLSTLYSTRSAFSTSGQFADLVLALATILDMIEAKSHSGKETAKDARFRRKVHIRTWRLLRQLRDVLPEIMDVLLMKTVSVPSRLATLLGHCVGVALRLKPSKKSKLPDGRPLVEQKKDGIITFYSSHILGSKSALPRHTSQSLTEFLSKFVDFKTLSEKLLPVAERMLLRSPEVALDLTTDLLISANTDVSSLLPAKVLPQILSASKSSNADTRSKAVDLFSAVISHVSDDSIRAKIATEVLALPKTGKTASAEHRVALFAMTKLIRPSDAVSVLIIDSLVPTISKENNEAAIQALGDNLEPHLGYILSSDAALASSTAATLAKELNSTKVPTRRALSNGVGRAIWTAYEGKNVITAKGKEVIAAIAPALEANLTSAGANPPSNPSGFLEGYVSAALAFGPLAEQAGAEKLSKSAALEGLLVVSPKASFLVNDKVYSKLPSDMDREWLLKALEGVMMKQAGKLKTGELRVAVGLAFLHLAFDTHSPKTFDTVAHLMRQQPRLVSQVIHDALTSWLKAEDERRAKMAKSVEDADVPVSKAQKIGRLLAAVFKPEESIDKDVWADIAVQYLVVAHHPEIGEDSQVSWISLIQGVGVDPATVLFDRKDKVLASLLKHAGTPPSDVRFAEAAYRAATTLAFIHPAVYVPALLDQIRDDLDPSSLDFIGLEERGIWATPADQTFVDVLSPKKDAVENKNRKDYATEKWEQEVRESLAKKKTASNANLSKADKAAVQAQLTKEAAVRQQIVVVQAKLKRGVEFASSLIVSRSEAMERYVGELAEALLASVFGPGSFLVDSRVFQVYMSLSSLVTERLGEYRRLLLASILRAKQTPFIADDYLHEDLGALVTRLLHQIHFVAEQSPLNSTSYALTSLLLAIVVEQGGIGTGSAQSEEAQEQLTLVVNIVGACCGEFQDDAYPRLETIKILLRIIGTHSKLAKDAASALTDLGAAIKDVATPDEIKEIISGTLSKDSNVRNAALQALQPVDLTDLDYSEELWIAAHDEDEQNANLANHVWEDNGLDIPESYLASLLRYLTHDSAAVRQSTAAALADAALTFPSQVGPTVEGLKDLYVEKAKILEPEYDRFGMVIPETVNRPDPFESRAAIASAFNKLTPSISQDMVVPIFDFLTNQGALGDRNGEVRRSMLNAAIALIDLHGAQDLDTLMKMFEDYLGKTGRTTDADDYTKEAVVILFGRLARHLDSSDSRVPQVVERLVEALNTPSELVQSAVADCLPPLVQGMGDEVEYLVDKLFSTLTTGAKYAGRRGAAYGLAGVIKGRGLSALKEYDLMDKLTEAAEDKTNFQSRQGAAFAFETLTATLGKVFEPYIISIVPLLLTLFGDGNVDVREATQDAAKVIMSKISGHCVKLMLPTLLGGLEEKQWRTKKGSIELLGSMAFCAPRQLSLSLPTIIPQLTGVINDSHAQVKSAANTSLKRFGEVLSNPEIKSIQSTLMKALADPAAKTNNALTALLKTTFEHYLDAPSLALVMPIIDRGLRQRSSDVKRRSVQIVGNMASLTESRDLVPYLNELMPLVREVLVDPVPEARATAAKSLGTLVERLGENNFPDLVSQLLNTLKADTSGVDRQGAAQGLSEVLSGLGMERLEGLLPEIISNTSSPRPYVREGFISLLVYLPATFGHRFAPHLGRVVPPILNGLADDSEYVREASMRAGKMIIANYSSKAIDLLLPELEKGMLDPSWRIRQSSISLTGELLYKVTGISGKVELEEEEAPAHTAENARKALLEALGQERRDRVLATLYIVRQDSVGVVRQASIHIWKALVHNTPRATREILPILMQILMSLLGSPEIEQQETASRTLGELCRKNGERIFGEILPILQKAISSTDERTKEGACLAFADVMAASNKDVIADHEETIISAIRTALVDPSAVVRTAAAKTFDTMQHYMGAKAIDQTIPTLLEAMRNPGEGSETALQALQEVMSVRANSVFPVLIPTLIAQPITAFNARALGALVKVAGTALNRRLDTVLGALVKSLEREKDEDVLEEINGAVESLLESVVDSDGVHLLEMLLFGWAKDPAPLRRTTACNIFATMCQVSQADTSDYRVDWIRILVSLFDDPAEEVVDAAWSALEHFVKTVDKDELEDLVVPLRRTIESTGAPGRTVPGFSRPKGVQSIVPILLAGILNGTQEQREQAAYGIGDLVVRTSEAAIKPYIIQLTGPLIRVISGQSIAPQIKSAILATLTVLLEQVPALVRPFHPQLTRTFVKSTTDPAAVSVRTRAAAGLGELMKHQPRVDPLVTELVGLVRSSEKDLQPSVLNALGAVCTSAGKNISAGVKSSVVELLEEAFAEGRNETYNKAVGLVVGGLASSDPESIRPIVETFLAAPLPPSMVQSLVILAILEQAPSTFHQLGLVEDVVKKVQASVSVDSSAIARPAREARDIMRSDEEWKADESAQALL